MALEEFVSKENIYKKMSRNESVYYKLHPFKDKWQLFNFRATASYYLCWYTLNKNPIFSYFLINSCIEPYVIQSEKGQILFEFYDFKAKLKFGCAEVSFCPDLCCASSFFGTWGDQRFESIKNKTNFEICQSSASNPCVNFGSGNCQLSYTENTNLSDLKNNKINVSCECPQGYRYTSVLDDCIDVDECLESNHDCDLSRHQACLNTPGSYICVCELGYCQGGFIMEVLKIIYQMRKI